MITLDVAGDIEYGILEDPETRAMASLLAREFSLYEPMAVAIGLSASEIERLVTVSGPRAVSEQLTLIAREQTTGDIVGALLVEDFGTPVPQGFEDAAPNFAPIGALLDSLDSDYRASRTILPGTHLHLIMLVVAHRASGRGIAQNLVTACLANGKARGYATAVAEATGSVSQHVFRKLGFRDVQMAPYKDFAFDGQFVFSSIAGPLGTILMEREV